jgi:hypothetical protein
MRHNSFYAHFLGGHCCLLGCNIKTAAAGVLCVSAWPKKRCGKKMVEKSLLDGRNAFVIGSDSKRYLHPTSQKT